MGLQEYDRSHRQDDIPQGFLPMKDGSGSFSVGSTVRFEEGRCLDETIQAGGRTLHVTPYTAVAVNPGTGVAETLIQIAESRAMETGQVKVDTQAMTAALEEAGKIALYKIYFDSGKASLKPESKPQFEQMAKVVQAQPTLKALLVGHTDNQGRLEFNMALSRQGAEAVVSELRANYKVISTRLAAQGVASLSPVSTNKTEEGRAKNRRVELVVQ
jgi:OmpA-OmpF porin, OOP family